MSRWSDFQFEPRIRPILGAVGSNAEAHPFGRPYLTGYQLAIEFEHRYPDDTASIGLPIGGVGVGGHNSLAQYIAGQLSRRIRAGELSDIEGAFLSDKHMTGLSFKRASGQVASSSVGAWDTALFRLAG